jgi:hypothetical protein
MDAFDFSWGVAMGVFQLLVVLGHIIFGVYSFMLRVARIQGGSSLEARVNWVASKSSKIDHRISCLPERANEAAKEVYVSLMQDIIPPIQQIISQIRDGSKQGKLQSFLHLVCSTYGAWQLGGLQYAFDDGLKAWKVHGVFEGTLEFCHFYVIAAVI